MFEAIRDIWYNMWIDMSTFTRLLFIFTSLITLIDIWLHLRLWYSVACVFVIHEEIKEKKKKIHELCLLCFIDIHKHNIKGINTRKSQKDTLFVTKTYKTKFNL